MRPGLLATVAAAAVMAVEMSHAEALDDADSIETLGADADQARTASVATTGAFQSLSQPAVVDQWRGIALGLAGYDSARGTGTFEALGEVRLWGPIAIRGGAVYVASQDRLRPSVGARLQALREGRHGIDGGFGVFYRPEGLTEPEGEIEGVVSVGKHVGQTYLLGNLLYGQDPEGNERDGEVRFAALRTVGASSRLVVGLDSRVRFDLGSDPAKLAAHQEATFDALLGPSATALVGPVALSLQAGGSMVHRAQSSSYGAFVLTGVGIVR